MATNKPEAIIAKLKLQKTDGSIVDATLYCHQETTTIAGTTYYQLKTTPADASGTTLSADGSSIGIKVWGKFVFPLTGIVKLLSANIYAVYRVSANNTTNVYNCQIDILIRKSDGTVRTTIATDVSVTASITGSTTWATYSGATYSFAEYTVVDQTDYLEIDYKCNVTTKKAAGLIYLRIDDQTLSPADQTRSLDWSLGLPPTVKTLDATNITTSSVQLNGEVTAINDTVILERGFDWGFSSGNYQYSWTETGNFGTGTFSYTVSNLSSGTLIYYRAKARNAFGWAYGSEKVGNTLFPLAPNWLTGWLYRKQHVIAPASGAGTNYQIPITVYYGSGTDGGQNVYLNGKCRGDFGDIRFTGSDGVSLLSYYIEEVVNENYAIFWVKIPDDISSNPTVIYIYYGKEDATTTSSGDNTFIFFDDFETGDLRKWTNVGAVWSVQSEIKKQGQYAALGRTTETGQSGRELNKTLTYQNVVVVLHFRTTSTVTTYPIIPTADNSNLIYALCIRAGYLAHFYGTWINYPNQIFVSTNTWYKLECALDFTNSKLRAWCNGIFAGELPLRDSVGNLLGSSNYCINAQIYANYYAASDYIDVYFIRKYTYPEPSNASWGSEEISIPAIVETLTANTFPMQYLAKPVKAQELISKVEGATITHIAQDYPLKLIKKSKAQELKSKF